MNLSVLKIAASLPKVMTEIDLDDVALPGERPRGIVKGWRSCWGIAQLFDRKEEGCMRLTVQRLEDNIAFREHAGNGGRPISWDELMAVKAECGFADKWAVEIFPPTDKVVNVAPMRHLWLIDPPDYGWGRD